MTERLDHHRQSQHTQFAKCPLDLSFEGMRHPVAAQHAFVEIEAERLAADTRGRVARLAPQYRPDARKKFADFDRLEYAIVAPTSRLCTRVSRSSSAVRISTGSSNTTA
jgi:hypothetical protein